MTYTHNDGDDDGQLDPVLARVQARLRRLMLIAGLTLGVGIFAVFGAILYRIVTMDASETPSRAVVALQAGAAVPTLKRSEIGVPEGAALVAAAAEGGRLYLTYAHDGGEAVVVLDALTMTVTGRLDIAAE